MPLPGMDENSNTMMTQDAMSQRATAPEEFTVRKDLVISYVVKLLVDNREVSQQKDRSYIQAKIVDADFPCDATNLPLGDFLWVVEVKYKKSEMSDDIITDTFVLDFVVERKTADDVAASIMDGRYKEQKYRLSICGLGHVYYLIEGKASGRSLLGQSTIDKAVMSTRMMNNFFVHHLDTTEDTIKWLLYMSKNIRKKIDGDFTRNMREPLTFKFNLNSYRKMAKSANRSVSSLFGNMLRVIKGCGREHTAMILLKFATPRSFYAKLAGMQTEEERCDYLSGGLKINNTKKKFGFGWDAGKLALPRPLGQFLCTLFTAERYPKSGKNEFAHVGLDRIAEDDDLPDA